MKQVEQDLTAVEEAAKTADIEEMRRLYHKSVQTVRDTTKLLDILVEHYSGAKQAPREASDTAIQAMQSVALAGIELAKATINRG